MDPKVPLTITALTVKGTELNRIAQERTAHNEAVSVAAPYYPTRHSVT